MARLLFLLVLIAVGVGCLGFYLGWFHLDSEKSDGKTRTTITVDMDKINADKKKVLDKVPGTESGSTVPPAK